MHGKRLYQLGSLFITGLCILACNSAYAQTPPPVPAAAPLQTLPNIPAAATPAPLPAITPLPTPTANPPVIAAPAEAPSVPANVAIPPATAPAPASTPIAPAAAIPAATTADAPLAAIPAAPAVNAAKLPDVLLVPTSANTSSLLFSKVDIDHLLPFIAVYESLKDNTIVPVEKDDLSSLLDTIKKGKDETAPPPPPPLPALYLGSIAYYSQSNWSVWLNGKKLLSTHNNLQNEFYVSQISRTSAEIIWKPFSMQNIPVIWKALTQNGAIKLPNVDVDAAKGTITLLMHTNQTFLPRSLAIREGLVKSINTGPGVAMPGSGKPNSLAGQSTPGNGKSVNPLTGKPNVLPGMTGADPAIPPTQPPKYQMPTLSK